MEGRSTENVYRGWKAWCAVGGGGLMRGTSIELKKMGDRFDL